MKTALFLCCLAAATALPYQRNSLTGFTAGPTIREDFGVKTSDFQSDTPEVTTLLETTDDVVQSDTIIDTNVLENQLKPAFSKSVKDGKAEFGALIRNEESSDAGKQISPSFGGLNEQVFDAQAESNQQNSYDSSFTTGQSQQSGFGQQDPVFDSSISVGQPQSDSDNLFVVQEPQPDSSFNFVQPQPNVGGFETYGSGTTNSEYPIPGPYNVVIDGEDDFYLRSVLPSAGYRPTQYTSLDLAKVDFHGVRNSGHKEYITVQEDDFSGEREIYRLVGVAPASAVRGGAATTYSANIANTVPVYRELDDDDDGFFRFIASRPSFYSAQGGSSHPLNIRAEATISGNTFAILLDD